MSGQRTRGFTYTAAYTSGLMAFGVWGATNHFASRAEIQTALRLAEASDDGWAPCGGMTLHEDDLRLLLNELGARAS